MGKRIRKLSLTINSFDAVEHLEPLIKEIRDQVDHVASIWQKKSYWGNPMAKSDMMELQRLKKIGLIDEFIEFKPDYNKYSREQECDKRNMGIDLMKKNGSSHVLNIDSDEYYSKDQFASGLQTIEDKGYLMTYCSYINYYKDFNHYLVYPFRPLVPWVHSTFFSYSYNGSAPGPTDPTRRILNPLNIACHVFPDEDLRMHHAAWIRKDIRKKLINWSAKNHFKKELIDKAVERWKNWKEGDKAIMLFNVPSNEITVKKLKEKMIKIEVPWVEES